MNKTKILVVDDEREVTDHLAKIISRRLGCIAEKAYNGTEALEKLRQGSFDLVVLDIRMPGLSGIDVIRETLKFAPQTKILAVSAYDSEDVANEALKAGAIDYMHKPQPIDAIALKIKQLLPQPD